MRAFTFVCGALLLAFGSGVHAQAPATAPKQPRFDCSRAKDPKACEERVKEHVSQRAKLREACKDKKGGELKACIREQRRKK